MCVDGVGPECVGRSGVDHDDSIVASTTVHSNTEVKIMLEGALCACLCDGPWTTHRTGFFAPSAEAVSDGAARHFAYSNLVVTHVARET